jgi:hypothetical protein
MGLFNSLKDNLSSFSGEQFIRKAVDKYGELQDFKLNSSSKTMFLKILLNGETQPVEIKVNKYSLNEENGRAFVRVSDVETSREWMTQLAKDYLLQQRFEIPQAYISVAKKFL